VLREAAKDLQRLRRITGIIGKYGYEGFVRRSEDLPAELDRGAFEPPTGELPPTGVSKARRFRIMLEELGPTFIKFGQVLSARPDLVSAEYIDELKLLQDHCEPLPFEDILQMLRDEWGTDPFEVLGSLDERPLATASIAQVHRGRTRDGDDIVVKVQRPGIEDEVRGDIDILYRVARLLDAVIEESEMAEPTGIVREFEKGLFEELNFRIEAANIREFGALHANRPDISIPRVFGELCTTSVLTLEYLEGVPFSRLPPDADRSEIAKRIVREAFEEVFIDGVFHADPHPGNLMYLGPGQYGMLDFGLLGRISAQMQETLVVFALAVALRDADSVARTLYRMGQADRRVDIAAVRRDVASLFERYLDRRLKDVDSQILLRELLQLAMKHGIRIPAEYTVLARAGATIEGLVRDLDPNLDVSALVKPFAEKLLMERVAPGAVQSNVYRALLQFQGLQAEVPIQLSQIMSDMASGRFGVTIAGPELHRLNRTIATAGTTLAGAVLAGAFIIGSFIGLARVEWTVADVPIVGVLGAALGFLVLVWLSGYALLAPRIRRFSVLRWMRRREEKTRR
jgi:ubiquinone biosynthesis protein